jgi:hypothetical protein
LEVDMMKRCMGLGLSLAALALSGCPMDDESTTSGTGGAATAATSTSASTSSTGSGGGGQTLAIVAHDADGTAGPADFSCRGTRTAPVVGPSGSETWPVLAFGESMSGMPVTVPGATVSIFAAPQTTGAACGAGCTAGEETSPGLYAIEIPGDGWFSYRVEADGFVPTIENRVELEAPPATNWLNLMRRNTLVAFGAILDLEVDPANALVAGMFMDCSGSWVENATLRVFDSAGAEADADVIYFTATNLPSKTQTATSVQGRWAIANAPAGAPIRVELWGALEDGAALTLLGCETYEAYADTLTTGRVGPLRADGPAACAAP